ncbi:MAG: LysM peptidoglycan-binding domain-containing protein [Crocinitomicaceae bacterium]
MRKLLVVLSVLISLSAFAQSKVRTIDGQKYFVHIVEKKQTLYGIHKEYGVKINDISNANQNIEGGLKVGQELLIPISFSNTDYYQKHTVKKGETLYAISKLYKTSVAELKIINPELAESDIQINQIIVVPKSSLNVSNTPSDQIIDDTVIHKIEKTESEPIPSQKDTLIKHTVLAHETLYSIAKRYMVTPDDIRKRNKLSASGIKVGDVIVVPVKAVDYAIFENSLDSSFVYSPKSSANAKLIVKKPVYKIALLLPLMYSANKSVMNKPVRLGEIQKLHPVTAVSSDFYRGFKMAADSLVKAGLNAEVYIYDTRRDTNTIASIFKKNDFSEIDMIVGPFFQKEIDYVAKYCKANKIPMVLPVNSNTSVLYRNPFVLKTTASTMTQMDGMVDFLVSDYSNYNICLVKPSSSDDKALYDRARDRYNSSAKPSAYTTNIVELTLGSSSGRDWNYKLKKDTVNIIVVPSNDVKFVTSVFTRVNNVLNINTYSKNMKVIVFGLEDWNRIEDIDIKHRVRTQQHYASYRFLDFNQPTTNSFFKHYRSTYGVDPDVSGVQGFDVGYYFLSAMYLYGVNYSQFLDKHAVNLVQNNFKFIDYESGNGKENKATCIVRYYKYDLQFISW